MAFDQFHAEVQPIKEAASRSAVQPPYDYVGVAGSNSSTSSHDRKPAYEPAKVSNALAGLSVQF